MYLTSNTAYIDRSQPPSVNQGGSGRAGAGNYIPPTYETIQDPPHGLRPAGGPQYDVLEPTPGEPRRGPPTSQVIPDAQDYEMAEPSHFTNPTYEVPVSGKANSQ